MKPMTLDQKKQSIQRLLEALADRCRVHWWWRDAANLTVAVGERHFVVELDHKDDIVVLDSHYPERELGLESLILGVVTEAAARRAAGEDED